MLNACTRFAYYRVLSEKMMIRKDIIRDNRSIKTKLEKQAYPRQQRFTRFLMNNQKKCLAGLVLAGVMEYYELLSGAWGYMRSIEPFHRKLQRWVLGVDNIVPPTILEQDLSQCEVNLNPRSIELLEKLYMHLEYQFKYGVNRKFLYTLYDELGQFEKDQERRAFFMQSGYSKRRNQKLCGVHCQQFILLFNQSMKKVKKTGESEEMYLERFCQKALSLVDKIKAWEIKVDLKRDEYKKLIPHLQDHKTFIIKQQLQSNPYVTFEEIEQELAGKGLVGMSIKDKIIVNFNQLKLHEVLLDSYQTKLGKLHGVSKDLKLRRKVDTFEKKVQFYRDRQEQLLKELNYLFKKQELFPLSLQRI